MDMTFTSSMDADKTLIYSREVVCCGQSEIFDRALIVKLLMGLTNTFCEPENVAMHKSRHSSFQGINDPTVSFLWPAGGHQICKALKADKVDKRRHQQCSSPQEL